MRLEAEPTEKETRQCAAPVLGRAGCSEAVPYRFRLDAEANCHGPHGSKFRPMPGQNGGVEEVLLGGNLSASVKIGGTVHRRAGPWTPAVQELLAYLRRIGFGLVPEPLGMDQQGRAVQSFLPGEVHPGWPDPLPGWMFEDETTLVAAAKLLRRFHDAVGGFVPPPDAQWRFPMPGAHEVICHNDWTPANALFRGHTPIGMLDWDSAGPGSRVWDLANAAFRWVPLNPRTTSPSLEAKAARFTLYCAAYGEGIEKQLVFDTLLAQLPLQADFIQREADAGDPGFAKLAGWNIPAVLRDDADRLRQQREILCAP